LFVPAPHVYAQLLMQVILLFTQLTKQLHLKYLVSITKILKQASSWQAR
jgi:hypothetical protein